MATKTIELPIRGMSCVRCVAGIEKGLSERDGVLRAKVNFVAEKVRVEFDPEQIRLLDLLVTIHELGYQAPVETLMVPIAGMSCASCVEKVERALLAVPGVIQAAVNLATEKARVDLVPEQVTVHDLARAIEAAGYRGLGRHTDPRGPAEERGHGHRAESPHDADDQAEPVLGLCLQPGADPSGRRDPVSLAPRSPEPNAGRTGHGLFLRFGGD